MNEMTNQVKLNDSFELRSIPKVLFTFVSEDPVASCSPLPNVYFMLNL